MDDNCVAQEIKHWEEKIYTHKRVSSIHNLDIAQYDGVGEYDIPEILPLYVMPKIKQWIGFNQVLSDKNPKGKGVHFFIDDYQFERLWKNPELYVDKLRQYECVLSPDFSPYGDMPFITQVFNHYRKHWIGRFLQEQGIKVIPTIRASTDRRSFNFYLDGEPCNSIVCISSAGTRKKELEDYFREEYGNMLHKLKPIKILIYGRKVDGLDGNIEYIETTASVMRRRMKDGKSK